MGHTPPTQQKVTWVGYLAFFITIIFFSGLFGKSTEWWRVFDFTVLNGSFGQVNNAGDSVVSFRGTGGTGAKDGFLFALELAPSVILSLGIISITEGLGGLRAAQQLMTPILRPLLGIPGMCSLALIANLQNTDAAAGMTKELAAEGVINEQERAVFATFQTSGSALLTNYFSSGAALFAFITVPVILPLAVVLVFKFVGANMLRLWIAHIENRTVRGAGNDNASA
ncbi:nucleoside recognition domain-containing protein [Scandinavium lactucae]|jgi:nucleoside recognition membrane protein YjiH|uniref:Nucleoside recognition domain-containing protein n=1 Tax=Scandinavium lactucae TaxID=3095028 RepID=A0ABU4QMY5_9ENTR|nr:MULTISPECIES: nucleoside recognition domain-containing protein [unclassified Scandinavium]MDX6040165.1 nucleoside recognition domain-containing protein [Scandinavium sp. V105_6]MDX6051164.1 nucleoside recognition domain-containing protein [Scandinavium sp. V105_1]